MDNIIIRDETVRRICFEPETAVAIGGPTTHPNAVARLARSILRYGKVLIDLTSLAVAVPVPRAPLPGGSNLPECGAR